MDERQGDDSAPSRWFRRLSGELLCPSCLAPHVDAAREFWKGGDR